MTNAVMSGDYSYREIIEKAKQEATKAYNETKPLPKTVASVDMEGKQEFYLMDDGLCGFAWLSIPDARQRFTKWLKVNGIGKVDGYYGGYKLSPRDFVADWSQSVERKEKAMQAVADVFSKMGIECYIESRLD